MIQKILLMVALTFSANAFATGGFSCQYTDDHVQFEIGGVTSRSFANEVVDFGGILKAEIGDDGSAFKVDKKFTRADLRQYWNIDDEFNVVIYNEDENSSQVPWVQAVVKTKANPDGEFVGKLTLYGWGWSFQDLPLTCGLE